MDFFETQCRMMALADGRKIYKVCLAILIQYRRVTDTQPPSSTQPASQPRCRSIYRAYYVAQVTRNSAIAGKPARRIYRSVKVTKHSTIPYVRYNFLFLFPIVRYLIPYDIWLQKCLDLEIGEKVTQGHWEWYHSIGCVWFPISVL